MAGYLSPVVAMPSESWRQTQAGVALLKASRLVTWDQNALRFSPGNRNDVEIAAAGIDATFGRVTLWLAFAAGAEYLLKGVCLNRNLITVKEKSVLRPPSGTDDLNRWVESARLGGAESKEQVPYFGTLASLPVKQLFDGVQQEQLVTAALMLLRETVRNRDAHAYISGVRDGQLHLVERLFVPALNAALGTLNSDDLRAHMVSGT